jgi:hypothetical protein
LPPACRLSSSALADPGNGNGGEGHGNSNDHDHENNGNGPDGNSGKAKDKANDDAAAVRQDGAAAEAERNGRDYVPDELVVANLRDDARSSIGDFGFVVLDERQLESLGVTIIRLRVPGRMTAPAARTLLATHYPGVLVDLNAIYRPQGAYSWSGSFAEGNMASGHQQVEHIGHVPTRRRAVGRSPRPPQLAAAAHPWRLRGGRIALPRADGIIRAEEFEH